MLKPGQSFGNYRILEQIGVGGMGAVYLAQHPLIGKKVALKVIHNDLSANKEVITRFFNEARAANQIGNDHIVQIHDFGQTDDGQHFYIMEYIEGRTLASVLTERRTLHPQRCLHISAQIASGLAAAHEANIIHRDLKPDNVMLVNRMGDADFVKILDFGLAKILDSQKQLTAIGVVLGTPQYMSPEACESRRDIDARSDVYSLGILMFQMLTGRVPFQGDSMGEVLVKQVTKIPPSLRSLNPAVPPSVEQIVLRCLAKDRSTRFQNMTELRNAVLEPEKYLASSPPVVQAAQLTAQSPKAPAGSTQFFHGAGDTDAAPTGAVGNVQENFGGGNKQTAYFAGAAPNIGPGAAPSAVARAAVAVADQLESEDGVDRQAVTAQKQPAHAQKTQYAGAPGGGAPPAVVGPASVAPSHAQKTHFAPVGQLPQVGPPPVNGTASADASTMYGEPGVPPDTLPPGNDVQPYRSDQPPGPRPSVVPGLQPPAPAKNVTMSIAPPDGYKEHPPQSSGKLIAAVAIVCILVGVAILGFVTPGFFISKDDAEAKPAVEPVDAGAPVAVAADAKPPEPAKKPDAGPKLARIEVESTPNGAEVIGADGSVLAKTPGVIELPIDGVERKLTFRHPDAVESETTTITPKGPALIKIQLETAEQRKKRIRKERERRRKNRNRNRNNGKNGKSGNSGNDDGTINPFKKK